MNYEAVDKSGGIWQYKDRPVVNDGCGIWVAESGEVSKTAARKVGDLGREEPRWKMSLKRIGEASNG